MYSPWFVRRVTCSYVGVGVYMTHLHRFSPPSSLWNNSHVVFLLYILWCGAPLSCAAEVSWCCEGGMGESEEECGAEGKEWGWGKREKGDREGLWIGRVWEFSRSVGFWVQAGTLEYCCCFWWWCNHVGVSVMMCFWWLCNGVGLSVRMCFWWWCNGVGVSVTMWCWWSMCGLCADDGITMLVTCWWWN